MQQWFLYPTHCLSLSLCLQLMARVPLEIYKKKSAAGARPDQAHCRGKRERVKNGMGEHTLPLRAGGEISKKMRANLPHTHTHNSGLVSQWEMATVE